MAAIIPLTDIRAATSAAARDAFVRAAASAAPAAASPVVDARRRPLHDLRISVTDRCNFRCVYCMPKDVYGRDFPFLPHAALLTFEEITRVAKVFVSQGVRKIRLTGGEPLLRRNLERLVEMLAAIGDVDLTLTTNGALLARKARALRDAGLNRVTVSLDALDDPTFRAMNDVDFPVARVLEGIDAAHAAGLAPIKINAVIKRGLNEHAIVPLARHFPAIARTSFVSSNRWTRGQRTAGGWITSLPPRSSSASTASCRSNPLRPTTTARSRSACGIATAATRSGSSRR